MLNKDGGEREYTSLVATCHCRLDKWGPWMKTGLHSFTLSLIIRLNPVEVLQRVEQNTRAMQEGLRELRQGVDTPNRSEKKMGF
jgi:hypothetical protein